METAAGRNGHVTVSVVEPRDGGGTKDSLNPKGARHGKEDESDPRQEEPEGGKEAGSQEATGVWRAISVPRNHRRNAFQPRVVTAVYANKSSDAKTLRSLGCVQPRILPEQR